ncbi:MAG: leucine-rich repeat protein [Abditibacteriota bacterium]|nr:leucine-rich repeat protein [Abditibacteriota bacterium]
MKNLKILFAIIILIATTVFVYAEEETKQVEATGYATIENNDISKAREEALNNAKIEALEMVCGVFIRANSTAKDYDIASKTIESYTNGYIKNFNISEDKKSDTDENTYFVKIKAKVVIKDIGNFVQKGKFTIKDKIITAYIGNDAVLEIPKGIIGIGYEAFSDCNSLQKIILPDSIKYISDKSFANCKSLKNINLPNNIEFIGNSAFRNCPIKEIIIPKKINKIYDYAFAGAKITELIIPKNINNIGDFAFSLCGSLETITFPNNFGNIGKNAFQICKSLETVTFPGNVGDIGAWAFSGCDSLESVTFSGNVGDIGETAFWNCESLNSVTFSGNVGDIGEGAFKNAYNLKTIKVPKEIDLSKASLPDGCEIIRY